MKKITSNKWFLYILGIFLFFGLWWILSLIINEPIRILPTPWSTIAYFKEIFSSSYLYISIGYTFLRMIIGFAISILFATIFGLLAGNYPKFKALLEPTMTALKSIPTVAVIFLFLALVGAKNSPILIVVLMSFPILYESIVGGMESIPQEIIDSTKVDGSNKCNEILKVKIPLAFPYFVVGILSSFSMSFKIEIMAEIISGDTSYGLGVAIKTMRNENPGNVIPLFSFCLVAVLLMLLVSFLGKIIKSKISKKIK